ncbi:MAG: hypothetical protein OXN94_05850 [Chloroflexota bacterium]|nr:hypothetical protein [Chloroflexota bacterium]
MDVAAESAKSFTQSRQRFFLDCLRGEYFRFDDNRSGEGFLNHNIGAESTRLGEQLRRLRPDDAFATPSIARLAKKFGNRIIDGVFRRRHTFILGSICG